MTTQAGDRWFVLTNAHGLRLAIQSGRLGCPPRSASSARDASGFVGGLPVLAHGAIPAGIEGVEGPQVALNVLAAAVRGAKGVPGTAAYYALDPIHLKDVRGAHFESQSARDEFIAGLRVLDPEAQIPRGRAVPAVVTEPWPALATAEVAVERGTLWNKHLARQERVSAALLLVATVLEDASPLTPMLERARAGDFASALPGLRDMAAALSRLDEISGWTGEQLATILESLPDPEVPGLAAFVRATIAAQDPFADAIPPVPTGPAQVALSALLPTAGLATPEAATYAIDSLRGSDMPEAAAMVGFAFSRTMLPRRIRPRELDAKLVSDDIRAAKRRVQSITRARPGQRQPKPRNTPPSDSLSFGL